MRKIIRYALIALICALVLATGFVIRLRPAPQPALPNPNGYDDFVLAAQSIIGDVSTITGMDHAALGKFLDTNAASLRLVRVGLTRQCSAPTAAIITNLNSIMAFLPAEKHLALLLVAEGKFAEQENRVDDAAQSYLATIRYGDEVSHGGLFINRLVGIACESVGFNPLVKLVPGLTCEQSRAVITELEKIDRAGVTWNEVRQGENAYVWHEMTKSPNPIRLVTGWFQSRSVQKIGENKHNAIKARLRLLAVELALRCYRAEHGKAANKLDQLVPQYLLTVPTDPFSRSPLVYSPNGTNWQIYSVGFPDTNGVSITIKLAVPDGAAGPK